MASQITATLPALDFPKEVDYPTQEDWAAFSAAAELNFGILGNDWSTQMQLWKDQSNAMSIELNNNADIAQGLANYQGDWISQGYTLGQTVSVSGVYYICKLTHATGQNPTDSESLYWNLALGNWSLKIDKDISPYTSKPTPIDSDLIPLSDSASSFGIKKLSWANIKATLATLFAVKDSPSLTGTPTAPTALAQTNNTQLATTAYVDGKMVLGTAVNSTSGTSIDFTSIPSWVKKLTVMFDGVSTNGSSIVQIQIGDSGGVENTGYSGAVGQSGAAVLNYATAFATGVDGGSSFVRYGAYSIALLTGNTWVINGTIGYSDSTRFMTAGGSKTLSGTLDRIRITTANGTDTFDAGQINIMYEG